MVAAQYGLSRNRGGRRMWSWQSSDGGRSWSGSEIPLPHSASMAADAVTIFGADGSALLGFLYADSATFKGGAAITRTGSTDLQFGPAETVVTDRLEHGGGAIDKGWLAVDRSRGPLRGTVYFSWHENRPLPNRTVESALWVASSRGGTRQWSQPTRVAMHFGGQIATASDGTLHLAWMDSDGRAILHTSSKDGAQTFEPVDTVVRVASGRLLDAVSVATAGDTLVACWTDGSVNLSHGQSIRCSAKADGRWASPIALDSAAVTVGFPAVAANGAGIWVLAYVADGGRTTVRLYRSVDGARRFGIHATLATRPIGDTVFCASPAAPCRRDLRRFFPGDYFGLAASADRLVAAYVLPAADLPSDRPSVFVSVIRP